MSTRHAMRRWPVGAITVGAIVVCACAGTAAGVAQQTGQTGQQLADRQSAEQQPAEQQAAVVLDRVVAVVNRRAILSSDLDDEIQLSVLDSNRVGQGTLTRTGALDQLISRALIEQQIRQEDAQAAEPPAEEVAARLHEIRTELPACVRANCASDDGWTAFLAAHGLTPQRVETYLRHRLEILRFIEQRFRQGIEIPQQQIAAYYNDTLLPQYAPGEQTPPLSQVAPRIGEILLQQRVNALFDDWLANLRKQGDVEVLDANLETADNGGAGGKTNPETTGPETTSPETTNSGTTKP